MRLRLPPLGDVVVRSNPIGADRNRTVGDGDHPAIRIFDDECFGLSLRHRSQKLVAILHRITIEVSGRFADADDVFQRAARLNDRRRQAIHLDIAFVADDKAPTGVEHHHALRHVV